MSQIERYIFSGFDQRTSCAGGRNPTGQSAIVEYPDQVLIIRPLTPDVSRLSPDEELKKRRSAIATHEKFLPDHTLPSSLVILQAEDTDTGKHLPALGRLTPRLFMAHDASEIHWQETFGDPDCCRALAEINFGFLRMCLTGNTPDLGMAGVFYINLLGRGLKIPNFLITTNVIVGNNKEGNTRYICDPDWCMTDKEISSNRIILPVAKAAIATFFTLRSALFGGLYLLHKTKSTFFPKPTQLQEKRRKKWQ